MFPYITQNLIAWLKTTSETGKTVLEIAKKTSQELLKKDEWRR